MGQPHPLHGGYGSWCVKLLLFFEVSLYPNPIPCSCLLHISAETCSTPKWAGLGHWIKMKLSSLVFCVIFLPDYCFERAHWGVPRRNCVGMKGALDCLFCERCRTTVLNGVQSNGFVPCVLGQVVNAGLHCCWYISPSPHGLMFCSITLLSAGL